MPTKFLNLDIDGGLTTNSDERVPSQKAVKTYVDNVADLKQNIDLDTPITVNKVQKTTVESALQAINVYLNGKQDQTLSTPIVVNGVQKTTVEASLQAINTYVDTAIFPDDLATVATTGSYKDLIDKPTIPDAQVQADWNEVDESDVAYIKNKPTIPTVDQTYSATSANAQSGIAVSQAIGEKQDKLSAGENIVINNNVISATDTVYVAGPGISIDEDSDENLVISTNQSAPEWGDIVGDIENQTDLKNLFEDKQDKLDAGENIVINGNTISAVDTKYIAGDGISIDEDSDENLIISNTKTDAKWGNITGDISDQTDLETLFEDKQDKLAAGENITIVGNTISATDTMYIAGDGISIDEDSDENLVISNTRTSAEWGKITGNIADQTDLSNTYQTKLTSTNKLDADYIVDGTTNKTVTAAEKTAWNDKQDKLTAGEGVSIAEDSDDNLVISVTGGGATYTAGAGIEIDQDSDENLVINNTLVDIVWTKDNLKAGRNISIEKIGDSCIIDPYTLAVFHFDEPDYNPNNLDFNYKGAYATRNDISVFDSGVSVAGSGLVMNTPSYNSLFRHTESFAVDAWLAFNDNFGSNGGTAILGFGSNSAASGFNFGNYHIKAEIFKTRIDFSTHTEMVFLPLPSDWLPDNKFHHVYICYDGYNGAAKLFIDGKLLWTINNLNLEAWAMRGLFIRSSNQTTYAAWDEIRLSSNNPWTTNFSVPVHPYREPDSDEEYYVINTVGLAKISELELKQDQLVSGTNIKTINNESLLGSGNLEIDSLPDQTGQSGKFLKTDGADAYWDEVNGSSLPDGVTIDLNDSDELEAIGVIDQHTSNGIKLWTGTREEYDNILQKDPYTRYITTDEDESGGGSTTQASWGTITGIVSNQVDLMNVFDTKANLDLSNINSDGKAVAAKMSLPSDRFTNLVFAATGSSYVAPSDGYFCAGKVVGTGTFIRLRNPLTGLISEESASASGAYPCVFLPVKKGDTVILTYNYTGDGFMKFIYAEGAE